MSFSDHGDIRIGTMVPLGGGADYVRQILPHGFESFEVNCWRLIGDNDLDEAARTIRAVIGDQAVISSVGVYGNPLQDEDTAKDIERMIRAAKSFAADVFCGFAGAIETRPVDESMPAFKKFWGEMARIAEGEGIRIAFENCDMGGTWDAPRYNIAHSPRAWEMMFNEVPGETLGLEWEPCHQMVSFIEPLAQLRKWVGKVHHVHGKDATVNHDVVREQGIRSGLPVVMHRTPGFGDTNWHDVITILRMGGFKGAIDIEGWHDPVYRDELEMTGQVYALNYLKACRGGPFIANPKTPK